MSGLQPARLEHVRGHAPQALEVPRVLLGQPDDAAIYGRSPAGVREVLSDPIGGGALGWVDGEPSLVPGPHLPGAHLNPLGILGQLLPRLHPEPAAGGAVPLPPDVLPGDDDESAGLEGVAQMPDTSRGEADALGQLGGGHRSVLERFQHRPLRRPKSSSHARNCTSWKDNRPTMGYGYVTGEATA